MRVVVKSVLPVSPTTSGSQSHWTGVASQAYHININMKNFKTLRTRKETKTHIVEAQPTSINLPGAGRGRRLPFTTPELPGEDCRSRAVHRSAYAAHELNHRPNAETSAQSSGQQTPEEWKTGILENGKAKIHPDEKRRDIVKTSAVGPSKTTGSGHFQNAECPPANNGSGTKQYATWAENQSPQKPEPRLYSIPKNAVY